VIVHTVAFSAPASCAHAVAENAATTSNFERIDMA